jgi:lipopolysaccharide export system protein LptA
MKPLPLAGMVFLVVGMLLACARVSAQGRVIVLENADHVEGKEINGESAREFVGNVRFSQENVHVTCDRALQMLASGRVNLTGNVVVVDDSGVTMRSPRGVYFRDERRAVGQDSVHLTDGKVVLTALYGEYFVDPKRAFFRNRVVVQDTASVINADSLTYFRSEKRSIAEGNVRVVNRTDNVTITGHRLDYWSARQFSRITDEPVLMQIDSNASGKKDTLIVRSLVMEAYRDSTKLLRAIDSVRMIRTDLAAVCRLAHFYMAGDSILLRGAPVVWYEETQVTGDSINAYLKERRLDRVNVMGNAFAISRGDTSYPDRLDQLTGEVMRMRFVDAGLKRIDVETRAISLYHVYEDSSGNGVNRTSGDRIVVLFEDGKAQSLRVVGGVEGQYTPENLLEGKESDFRLVGFHIHTNRPRMYPVAREKESQTK